MKVIGQAVGFKELSDALKALPDRMATQVIGSAVRQGAVVIEKAMIEKAPADGRYAPSKAHEEYGPIKDNIEVKAFSRTSTKVIYQVGVGKAFWARWIEFGRLGSKIKKKKMLSNREQFFGTEVAPVPAHPFLRPAFDENGEKATTTIITAMVSGLSKVAAKLVADYGTARSALLTRRQRF